MTTARMIELVVAVLLLAAGIVFYRRKPVDGSSYGNQGAVLMLAIGAIVGIHALGGLDYHPTQTETDMMKASRR